MRTRVLTTIALSLALFCTACAALSDFELSETTQVSAAAEEGAVADEAAVAEVGDPNVKLASAANVAEMRTVNDVLALSNGDTVIQFSMSRAEAETLIGTNSVKTSNGMHLYIDAGISLYYIDDTVAAMKPVTKEWTLPSGISLGSTKADALAAYSFTSVADNGVNQLFCMIEDGEITTIDWDTFIDPQNKEYKYFMSINANVSVYDLIIRDWRFMESYADTTV